MSRDFEPSPYARGPLPANVRPLRRPKPAPKPSGAAVPPPAAPESRPAGPGTIEVHTASGVVWENPNKCMICHRPRHQDTPHHDFIPDQASPVMAAKLGWPTPRVEVTR